MAISVEAILSLLGAVVGVGGGGGVISRGNMSTDMQPKVCHSSLWTVCGHKSGTPAFKR